MERVNEDAVVVSRPQVDLFTDGACLGNPGPGGWAYILKHRASGRTKHGAGGERETTNNRMEMLAVINGLKALHKPSIVHLYSDSEYVVKGVTERMEEQRAFGWRRSPKSKKPIKNVDLWKTIYDLSREHQVAATWIRGHAGHPENEQCDQMAVAQAGRASTLPARTETPNADSDLLFGS